MSNFVEDMLFLFEVVFWWPVVMLCGAFVAAAALDAVLYLVYILRGGGHREGPL